MITDLISISDAFALLAQIPDVIDSDGAKRQAESIEAPRIRAPEAKPGEVQKPDTWYINIPRSRQFVLPNGKKLSEPMQGHNYRVEQVYTQTVTIGDKRIPVILAMAILNAYFVALENGDVVPTALVQP